MSRPFANSLSLIWVLALLGSVGCATMPSPANKPLEAQATAEERPHCTIDMRPAGKEAKVGTMEIAETTTVQELLERTGASKKFPRLEAELYRQQPNGAWLKMVAQYDRNSKKVDPMYDYNVRPGDRLVIKEDATGMFDDMLQAATGPLGKRLR